MEQVKLTIDRSDLFDSSCQIVDIPVSDLQTKRLTINFKGEEAVDLDGVKRDFMQIISTVVMNPECGLFIRTENKKKNEHTLNPDCLSLLGGDKKPIQLIGRLMAICIMYRCTLGRRLSRPFLKALFQVKMNLDDFKEEDPETYTTLKNIQDNNAEDLDLTFSTCVKDGKGCMMNIDLMNEGSEINVTDENKHDYIEKYIYWYFQKRIAAPIKIIQNEFRTILSSTKALTRVFKNISEIQDLLCGEEYIDLLDMYKHTIYSGALKKLKEADPVSGNFWKFLFSLNSTQLSSFLYFSLGTSKPPIGGFQNMLLADHTKTGFTIVGNAESRFMTANTCFNSISIPMITDYVDFVEAMINSLASAMGFGGID